MNKLLYFARRQNLIALRGKSFIHATVKMRSASISGEVNIGEECKITNGVRIVVGKPLTIGRFTTLDGPNIDIVCAINPVSIGSFCSIARSVSIQEYNHKIDRVTSYFIFQNVFKESLSNDIDSNGAIEIGNDVWIGAQSVILSGAKIGNGAIIGANSVVRGEIPPYAIAVGSPAKVIKYRFDQEVIDLLLDLQWWDWPIDKIKSNRELFQGTLTKQRLLNIIQGQ